MNIKDYISSGQVESYVLGLSSPEERQEFEELCARYPELVLARDDFELALEKQLLKEISPADPILKESIMNSLSQENILPQARITPIEDSPIRRNNTGLIWMAAASFILLLVSAYFAYDFYKRNQELQTELARSKESQADMNERLNKMEEENRIMSDPDVAVVNMIGTQSPGKASANIYWDSASTDVYLVVKNMPSLPSDKQYQLWAIINGEPRDLGLFDVGNNKKLFFKMRNTQKADAFAITIEARGNTGGPQGELQSQGKPSL